jgi:hypothetical protein
VPEDYLERIKVKPSARRNLVFGATALENFGVEVDPIQKKLKPISAIIGGFITFITSSQKM